MNIVEAATLRKLQEDMGEVEVMRELLDTFLEEGPRLVALMVDSAARGDRRELNRGAHSLRSTAATFGAVRLADLCRDLESASKQVVPVDAKASADAIRAEWATVAAELRRLRP